MKVKICLCTAMEAGIFDDAYFHSESRPEAINWYKNSDGSYETGSLRDEDVDAKVKCQCGEYMYMETHLEGRYRKRMVAVCSCDNPKPKIMECDQND